MDNIEIFEVTRADYKAFVERLIPGKGEVVNDEENFIKMRSRKTGKYWCGRRKIGEEPEQYFIFEYPDPDEWGEPIPKVRLVLETAEEVQAVIDALAEMRKNGGTIQ